MTALALKSTLAIAVAFLAVVLASRARASVRHMILASLFTFLLLLPLAQSVVPAVKIEVANDTPAIARALVAEEGAAAAPAPAATEPIAKTFEWRRAAAITYVSGAVLFLLYLAIGVWRLRRLAQRSEVSLDATAAMNALASECGIRRPALVVFSRETAVPLTFGFRTSTIVLPAAAASWNDEELGRALRHELEHVRRDDWFMQLIARAACAIYWPHPFVWIAWRRFCFEAERACDDAVLGTFAEAEAYAGQLVTLAREVRRMTAIPALGMASRSKLAARVNALLDPAQRRGPLGAVAASFVIATTFLFLVTIAPARLVAAVVEAAPAPREVVMQEGVPYVDQSPLGEAFVISAGKGLTDDVGRMIAGGVDPNIIHRGDGTALIAAARGGYADTVLLLLENGADPNLASPGDGNPLIAAAKRGHGNIVDLLIQFGAKVDTIVPGDENPLIQAAWHGHSEVVASLIGHGANVNVRAYERGELRTPLRMATRAGHEEIVRMLRAAGARE